jgi:hypothetical protein
MTVYRLKRHRRLIYVVLAASDCEFGQLQAKRDAELGERKDRMARAITYLLPGRRLYLLFRPNVTINDIAHEVFHAIKMLRYRNEEWAATAAGDLVEGICRGILPEKSA